LSDSPDLCRHVTRNIGRLARVYLSRLCILAEFLTSYQSPWYNMGMTRNAASFHYRNNTHWLSLSCLPRCLKLLIRWLCYTCYEPGHTSNSSSSGSPFARSCRNFCDKIAPEQIFKVASCLKAGAFRHSRIFSGKCLRKPAKFQDTPNSGCFQSQELEEA
jgi:hypothetical protein